MDTIGRQGLKESYPWRKHNGQGKHKYAQRKEVRYNLVSVDNEHGFIDHLNFDYVLPDDVKAMAKLVMGHRVVVQPAARLRNLSSEQIINEVLNKVSVPGGDFSGSKA